MTGQRRERTGLMVVNLDDHPADRPPEDVPPDTWRQLHDALVMARCTGSVGGRVEDRHGHVWGGTFLRLTEHDDPYQVSRATRWTRIYVEHAEDQPQAPSQPA